MDEARRRRETDSSMTDLVNEITSVNAGATLTVGGVTLMGWLSDNYYALAIIIMAITGAATIGGIIFNMWINHRRFKMDYGRRKDDV